MRVQGGATWRELDAATHRYGLAVTGARIPSVGVAGFTLGSGSGWLERKLGLAADYLRCAPRGDRPRPYRHGEPRRQPDLFWALRGGGPSFGVVSSSSSRCIPSDRRAGGMLAWPIDRLAEVASAYAELMGEATDDLGGALGADQRGAVRAGAAP